jgi:hypothetical protein
MFTDPKAFSRERTPEESAAAEASNNQSSQKTRE